MTWREWLGFGAGLLALTALFLPWTQLSATDPQLRAALAELPSEDVSRPVWSATFFGWFPPLLLVLTGLVVAIFGQSGRARWSGLPQLWLVATVVAFVGTVLGWVFIDWQFGEQQRGLLTESGVSIGTGIGRYLGVAATLVSLTGAVLDVVALRAETRLPGQQRVRR
ncbi:hypothetical protein FHU38_004018 [Saccharomonospora amisosensis]|uniref:Uncharacterized protein n=1 Tax=Saccharomonospora amisosensis TaxID=1128677 RepID=A0A7X5ZS79_9PSEU|nr:hypothetical protein [Saccharomonospora amisosensis]NIJ13674.1 hypothetical protein [Saccharomonospora amisosensis]